MTLRKFWQVLTPPPPRHAKYYGVYVKSSLPLERDVIYERPLTHLPVGEPNYFHVSMYTSCRPWGGGGLPPFK
jgi:hypothetical protein